MKKLLLALFCVLTTLTVFAEGKVYTEPLIVTVNGESSDPQDASVTVIDNGDETINFELKNFFLVGGETSIPKNFFLVGGETSIPVGNIEVEKIPVTKGEDGLGHILFDGTITIQPGDMEGIDTWVGPMVGEIPMKLQGKLNDEKLYVTIDIDMQETLS